MELRFLLSVATEPRQGSDVGSGPIDQFKILKSLRGRLTVRIFQVNAGEAVQARGFLHRDASPSTAQGTDHLFSKQMLTL